MAQKLLQRELDRLKEQMIDLGRRAELQVRDAMQTLMEHDTALGEKVIASDEELDRMEVELEEECLKILALHQPFATDLRFVIAVLKMNSDIERIGDLAVDIARRAMRLTEIGRGEIPEEISQMAQKAKMMFRKSLLALIDTNSEIAQTVLEADALLDELNKCVYDMVIDNVKQNPENAEEQILLLTVARRLERIGDHATNVAEDVIYMNSGDIIRHGKDESLVHE